jgi:hypothetical protein
MRNLSLLLFVALSSSILSAQTQTPNPEDALHAPDGGAREMIMSISFPPVAGAPFQATVNTQWTKYLPDGSTSVLTNHRFVARDGQGRVYQERRTFVPEGSDREPRVRLIEISSPVTHTKYFCDPSLSSCELQSYNAPIAEAVVPIGPIGDGKRELSRASLGTKTIEGVEVIGTRETITIAPGSAIGNTAPVEETKEFWYSPKLGINLQVTRLDPMHGDQVFTVTGITLSEPDARLFVLPAKCKVADLRVKPETASTSAPAR